MCKCGFGTIPITRAFYCGSSDWDFVFQKVSEFRAECSTSPARHLSVPSNNNDKDTSSNDSYRISVY